MKPSLFILLFPLICFSCQQAAKKTVEENPKREVKESDVRKYISKYLKHDVDLTYEDSLFDTQQPKEVADVNGDGKIDSVFVMSPLHGKDTFAYYFLDTNIPRLALYYSYCADNKYIFPVCDIDGDGGTELGIMQFTCNSRTQSLLTYSLQKEGWKKIGECTYDMNHEEELPMEQRIVKTGKGKFKMFHINYDAVDDTLIKEWRRFTF